MEDPDEFYYLDLAPHGDNDETIAGLLVDLSEVEEAELVRESQFLTNILASSKLKLRYPKAIVAAKKENSDVGLFQLFL